ncbi:hypothetical protein [Haemophilus haemolyticus]|uniref:Pseudouridine synthase n=1 Tax=Haemophilus haemolyticus TaxID=726 RepID=A0A1B8PDR4_HAEHA|nr:hypothetical protein [Haemophilus haemolyticus]OBX46065.1 hypothetical protein A9Z62_02195 [Haemophilus haemolyticus]
MKKSLTLAVLSICAASSVFATSDMQQKSQPILSLSVYDMSGQVPMDLGKKEISRSIPKQQLCWTANGEFDKQISVIEIFKSPKKMTFSIPKNLGSVKTSKDGKTHTIAMTRKPLNQGKFVVNCWRFDEKDPVGQYSIQVQLGNIVYEPFTFNVVE